MTYNEHMYVYWYFSYAIAKWHSILKYYFLFVLFGLASAVAVCAIVKIAHKYACITIVPETWF